MKKFFALTLAVAMVLSLAAVSFAAVKINVASGTANPALGVDEQYLYTYESGNKLFAYVNNGTATVPYGKTIAILLTDAENDGNALDLAKSGEALKVSAKWSSGASNVKSTEIVKKKVAFAADPADGNELSNQPTSNPKGKSVFMIAITTTGFSTGTTEVAGELKVTGRTGDGRDRADIEVDVEFTLGFGNGKANIAADSTDVTETNLVYNFENAQDDTHDDYVANIEDDADEYTITFGSDVEVVANIETEKKIVMSYDEDTIDDIDDAYPDANLDYYALTAKFRKTATVYILADEGSYLYEVVDGELKEMKAEYDEWDEAFTFKAKELGTYVVSDAKLDLGAAVETAPANPSTGAAA